MELGGRSMAAKRYLIVNADDFGQSPGVNRGIIEAHEKGLVTSASLMVRWPAAAQAAAYGQAHPDFSLGLHVDLGEWAYRDGTWVEVYQVVPPDDRAAVAEEVSRQYAAFHRLVGRDPTHLDSHQHVHRQEPLLSILSELAAKIGAPLRLFGNVRYCGDFYGQTGDGSPLPGAISVKNLIRILKELPLGFTELACHPGLGDDLDSMYRRERAREVKTLCSPRVRAAVAAQGIELCSFHDVVKVSEGQQRVSEGCIS
jgi:predicted glycoside hydrolase/deacetylase ChbG (UPF0249 family)